MSDSDELQPEPEYKFSKDADDYSYAVTERNFISLMIDLYRGHPILWKVKHEHYTDKVKRKQALDKIVKELQVYKPNYTEEILRKKINIIRTNFNKERNKVDRALLRGEVHKPVLWYYNELLFLNEAYEGVSHPRRHSNYHQREREREAELEQEPEEYYEEVLEANHDQEDEPSESPEKKKLKLTTPEKRRLKTKLKKSLKKFTVKKQLVEPEPNQSESESDLEQCMTVTTTYYKKRKTKEDILAKNWAMRLKKMTTEQRLFAEKIISDVVFEGELGNLTKNGVSFCPSFP